MPAAKQMSVQTDQGKYLLTGDSDRFGQAKRAFVGSQAAARARAAELKPRFPKRTFTVVEAPEEAVAADFKAADRAAKATKPGRKTRAGTATAPAK
jgi:hypothetical protein